MQPFFVLIAACGFFSCERPTSVEFEHEEACIAFVEAFKRNKTPATCFERSTGRIVIDSFGRNWSSK